MALFTKLGKYNSTALLLMRIGIGIMMMLHGYPKIIGGPEKWAKLGGSMKHLGMTHYPEIWGFFASMSEGIGGLFILLGFFFRPSAFFLLFTMLVAATMHIKTSEETKLVDIIMDGSHAIELGFVFLALFIMGPGKYSIDKS